MIYDDLLVGYKTHILEQRVVTWVGRGIKLYISLSLSHKNLCRFFLHKDVYNSFSQTSEGC